MKNDTKITLTLKQIKKLVKESPDIFDCPYCGYSISGYRGDTVRCPHCGERVVVGDDVMETGNARLGEETRAERIRRLSPNVVAMQRRKEEEEAKKREEEEAKRKEEEEKTEKKRREKEDIKRSLDSWWKEYQKNLSIIKAAVPRIKDLDVEGLMGDLREHISDETYDSLFSEQASNDTKGVGWGMSSLADAGDYDDLGLNVVSYVPEEEENAPSVDVTSDGLVETSWGDQCLVLAGDRQSEWHPGGDWEFDGAPLTYDLIVDKGGVDTVYYEDEYYKFTFRGVFLSVKGLANGIGVFLDKVEGLVDKYLDDLDGKDSDDVSIQVKEDSFGVEDDPTADPDKPEEKVKKWYGDTKCDFCHRDCGKTLYDGMTGMGPWAVMCEPCFHEYGVGLGLGKGQKYKKVGDEYIQVDDKRKSAAKKRASRRRDVSDWEREFFPELFSEGRKSRITMNRLKKLVKESSFDSEDATPDNVNVGDIVFSTAYYDFKIHTFYKVVDKRGKSTIVIQRLEKEYNGTQSNGVVKPTDKLDSRYGPITVRYGKRGFKVRGDSLRIWDGTPLEEYDYS